MNDTGIEMPRERRSARIAIALGVFGSALAMLLGGIWAQGPTEVVPTAPHPIPDLLVVGNGDEADQRDTERWWEALAVADQRFAVWATAHGARALFQSPSALFDARSCYPARDSLAYGHPLLTFGLLGAPAYWLTGDPVATYNLALLVSALAAALAMALLVQDWTGRGDAALVAGLLFAFHGAKLEDAAHAYLLDTSWAVLALFFGRRFFVEGRLRDAVGGAVAVSLQIAGSFYSLLASCLVGTPMLVWLVGAHGLRAIRPGPLIAFCAIVAATTLLVMGPYFQLEGLTTPLDRSLKLYRSWSRFAPGAWLGWTPLLLAIAAFSRRRGGLAPDIRGDPRPFLVAAVLLGAWFATGGNVNARAAAAEGGQQTFSLPNPYAGLATLVPGLAAVRVPALLESSVHLGVSLLAGLGVSALLSRVPARFTRQTGVAMVAIAWLVVARPAALGLSPAVELEPLRIRPSAEVLDFYAALERQGDAGPLLEISTPASQTTFFSALRASNEQLLSSYHGRRTSSCFNSYHPRTRDEVMRLARLAPNPAALEALYDLGFRTLILHHGAHMGGPPERFARAERRPGSRLERLHDDGRRTAYRIHPAPPAFQGSVSDPTRPGERRPRGAGDAAGG